MTALLLIPAMILDALLGEPRWLWSRWPHPAVVMGRAVAWADATLNNGATLRARGVVAMLGLGIFAGLVGAAIAAIPDFGILEIIVAAMLLAQRSLAEHVQAVGDALRLSIGDGKQMVARIVGRDTAGMDEPAVVRAAIESGAENLSDGVIAPAFWFLLAGLPGLLIYKVTNTADSMIGHRTPKYEEFGWAAARFDDLLNLIPARLTAVLIAVGHLRWPVAPILRDAPLHRSPNAGWPEAAMAVVLNVALSGPRSYDGNMRDFPWVWPEGSRDPGPDQIDASVQALWRAWAVMLALVVLIALV
jgi:adenosylcobinamide-phosphate synthase